MPGITAEYGKTKVVGYNAADRTGSISREAPSIKIKRYAEKLGDLMDKLDKERGRSAYACAEAQALALLLGTVGEAIDFSKIVFGVPNSDGGYLLWHPCGNCAEWLEQKEGWGSSRTYGLKKAVLALVVSTPSSSVPSPDLDLGNLDKFPPLGARK